MGVGRHVDSCFSIQPYTLSPNVLVYHNENTGRTERHRLGIHTPPIFARMFMSLCVLPPLSVISLFVVFSVGNRAFDERHLVLFVLEKGLLHLLGVFLYKMLLY